MKAVVSNGFGQFHLRGLAQSLAARGNLSMFVTGALPPRWLQTTSTQIGALRRWKERELPADPRIVFDCKYAEVLNQISQAARSRGLWDIADRAALAALRAYQRRAARLLAQHTDAEATVYHYRAGYGGASLDAARERGLALVCDHSIAAPRSLDGYVPQAPPTRLMPRMWEQVDQDIQSADTVIVNSDFVRQTFSEAGYETSNVAVVYTPVDWGTGFYTDGSESRRTERPHVVFAGTAEYRKGIDIVAEVARRVSDRARFTVIGSWSSDAIGIRDSLPPDVGLMPKLSREDLAAVMRTADVLLFPSRAEGSARIVAEALVSGCYVITSRMAGSSVRDGLDGAVIPSTDPDRYVAAINEFLALTAEEKQRRRAATREYARWRHSPSEYVSRTTAAYGWR